MDTEEKRANAYVIVAIAVMLSSFFLVTFVHESGHAVAATLLGGEVTEFNVTPFNGGHVKYRYTVEDPEHWIIVRTVVDLSGGLAVALLFALLGFFKRSFLIVVPLQIIDGITEVFQMGGLHTNLQHLTALTIVIAINHVLYIKLWRNKDD